MPAFPRFAEVVDTTAINPIANRGTARTEDALREIRMCPTLLATGKRCR